VPAVLDCELAELIALTAVVVDPLAAVGVELLFAVAAMPPAITAASRTNDARYHFQ
jgi:hypothetical protein